MKTMSDTEAPKPLRFLNPAPLSKEGIFNLRKTKDKALEVTHH